MSERMLTVSSSPHARGKQTTKSIMTDVIIALLPATAVGIYVFGLKAAILVVTGIATCVLTELVCEKLMHRDVTVGDMSAALTGLLLALNVPVNCPWWVLMIGCVFAIVAVKQIFGGLGCNFANPALAARVLLVASWPSHMTGKAFIPVDAVVSATPLAIIKEGGDAIPSALQMFLGFDGVYGCIGEISAAALILGFIYLLYKKVISWRIPVIYVATVAVLSFCFGLSAYEVLIQVLAGGLMLGAIFMATDYVTSPATAKAQFIYAFGCGLMTVLIRQKGGYPEGVSFSILFMNFVTPLLDKYMRITKYGEVKK